MRKIFTFFALLFSMMAFAQSTTVVISQAYGGGGGTTGTYKPDYVELHNISSVTQSLDGKSLQYGAATGQLGNSSSAIYAFPTGTSIPAGGYLLIQLGSVGTGGVDLPVTPDLVTTNLNMSAASGKVALANQTTSLACGATATPCILPASSIIDLVAWGASSNGEGGTTVNNGSALTSTQGAVRKGSGCTETDNNNNDFDVVTAPVPRNSASPVNICGGGGSPTLSVSTLTSFANVCINTTAGPNSFTISGSNLTTADVSVAALAGFTYSTTSGGTYSSTLTIPQTGGTFSQQVFVKFSPTAIQSYSGNIVVSGGGAASSVNVAAVGGGVNAPPTVTTGTTTGITTVAATAAGTITDPGCTSITEYGIEYSTTNGFTNGSGTRVPASNLSSGAFSSNLSGLTPGLTYYYKAYATNGAGTSYGTQDMFTTTPTGPSLTAGTVADFGNVIINTQSTSQSFTLSGSNLTGSTGSVTVSAPSTDFEVSNDNNTWGATTLVAYSSGTISNATVYVRFTPQSLGAKSGNITISGGGANTTVAVSGTGIPVPSPLLLTEPFNYTPDGTSGLQAQSNGAWIGFSTGDSILVAAGNLSYSGLTASTGNKISFDGAGKDYYTPFTSQTSGSVYSSFILNVPSLGALDATGGYIAGFTPDNSTTTFGATVWTRASTTAGKYNIGIATRTTTADVSWIATDLDPGTSYFVVIAYDITTGTANDVSRMWLNPVPGNPEPAAGVTAVAGADLNNVGRFFIRQDSNNETPFVEMDELRVGTTWAAVTPAGAATPAITISSPLTAFGNVCVNTTAGPNSFTISGSNLTNADVTVAALAGFTYSTTAGGTYTSTLTLPQSGGTFSQQVFVKFTPTAVQSYSGNIVVNGGGISAAVNVAAAGAGINTKPALTTGSASAITTATATAAGTITDAGCSSITEYGIEFSTTNGFADGAGTKVPATNLSSGAFSSNLSGLSAGITYYYKAYATNGGGTGYGAQQSFTTTAPTPVITTDALTAFGNVCLNTTAGPNSFTITGSNLTNADVTVAALAGFTYSTTAGGTYTSTLTLPQGGGAFSQQVFVKFTPTAVQSYNGNIVVNGGGISAAVNVAASGAGINTKPALTTGSASAITTATATAAGTITDAGCSSITEYGIEYSTTNGFADGAGTKVPATNLSSGAFSSNLSGLSAGITYYYKAYATNGGGTGYGTQQSFTTTALTPTITTTALTAFGNVCVNTTAGPNSFTITGSNLTNADVTVAALAGFTYSTTAGGTYTSTLTLPQSGGAFSQQVFVKFAPTAVQSYNGNIVVNGGGISAAVNVAASGAGINSKPSVTAGSASAVTQTTATVAGTISDIGCSAVTAYGIEYNTTSGFANGSGAVAAASNLSGGTFSSNLTLLTANTTYYFHAFATNSAGTSYSTEGSFTTSSATGTGGVVISQVYGGGGNTSATYNQDFVELFNRTGTTVDISGWSVQYASATGPSGSGNWAVTTIPASTTLAPGKYYLVALATGSTGIPLPTPDVTNTGMNLSGTAGKVALVSNNTALNGTTACSSSTVVDVIGYGTTATCSEGSIFNPTGIDNTKSIFRKSNGCTETNDNSADFEVLAVVPRNSASPANICSAPVPALSVTALTAFGNVCVNTTAGPNSFTISGTNLTNADVSVAALAGFTYSTTSGGTYTSTLTLPQSGGTFSQQVFVKFTPTAVQSYNGNIVVSGGGASASVNAAASGAGVNTAPAVTTGAASGVTSATATLAGSITDAGCTSLTEYGIEYSTTNGFANGSGIKVTSSNLASGSFTSALSGLSAGITYYYKAYATNGGGTTYGTQQQFTTATLAPTLAATALTGFGNVCTGTTVGPNSFTISGSNLTNADVTVAALAGFTYSTTSGGTYTSTLTLPQSGGTFSQQVFVKFSPVAVQSYNGNIVVAGGGASASVNVAATGSGVNTPPSVTTGGSSAVTTSTATLAGTITATGCTAVTAYGIEYSTTNGFANGSGTQVASSNLASGAFSSGLSGLAASTTYYYKAYATNGGGTTYGSQLSFTTTAPPPPTITTTALTAFGNVCVNATAGPNSFTISGSNLTNANITVGALAGFTYATTANGTYSATLNLTQSGGTYSQQVFVKFTPTTVQNYSGNIPVSGGGVASTVNVAVTGAGVSTAPTVITGAATNIFTSYATLGGQVTDAGCTAITQYGIEYSGINGFANGNGTKVYANNLASGQFSALVNGLVQGGVYYFKAFVTNAGGTSYGAQQTFTVASIPAGFTVYPVPAIRGSQFNFSMSGLTPGYYGLLFYGADGRLAYQYNMNIQVGFINQGFTLPATLAAGIYRVQLVSSTGTVATHSILVQ